MPPGHPERCAPVTEANVPVRVPAGAQRPDLTCLRWCQPWWATGVPTVEPGGTPGGGGTLMHQFPL